MAASSSRPLDEGRTLYSAYECCRRKEEEELKEVVESVPDRRQTIRLLGSFVEKRF